MMRRVVVTPSQIRGQILARSYKRRDVLVSYSPRLGQQKPNIERDSKRQKWEKYPEEYKS